MNPLKISYYHYVIATLLLFGVCLCPLNSFAQGDAQKSPALLNYYTLGDKEGFNGVNYVNFNHQSDGSVLTKPYSGTNYYVYGNNYHYDFDKVFKISDKNIIAASTHKGYYFFVNSDSLYIIRPNKTVKIIKHNFGNYAHLENNFIFNSSDKRDCVHIIANDSIIKLNIVNSYFNFIQFSFGDSTFLKTKDSLKNVYISYLTPDNKVVPLHTFKTLETNAISYKDKNGWHIINPKFDLELNTEWRSCNSYALTNNGDLKLLWHIENGKEKIEQIDYPGGTNTYMTQENIVKNRLFLSNANKPIRISKYLHKFPKIYNNTNANEVFSLVQDEQNRIWASSYQGNMAIIDKNNVTDFQFKNALFLNGSISIGKYLYISSSTDGYELTAINDKGVKKTVGPFGFSAAYSKDSNKVFFGGGLHKGVMVADTKDLKNGTPKFSYLDSTKGIWLKNIITLAEDKIGRIWAGQQGLALYEPKTQIGKTWMVAKKEIGFGVATTKLDSRGTMWLTGYPSAGLRYYNSYEKPFEITDIKLLDHPLSNSISHINSITIWGKYIIMGGDDKMLLFDLEEWYTTGKIIMRYLNPHEAAFSSIVEQNVFVTDRRDSTLWFSTSNMLYNWDVKSWLAHPTYKVSPNLSFTSNGKDSLIKQGQIFEVEPDENTIDLLVWFQSPDNMPRYMSIAFVKNGDSLIMPAPSLENNLHYANLAPGSYTLYVDIFQSDGTTSHHQYKINVDSFWWQKWWSWLLISLTLMLPIISFLNERRKRALLQKKNAERDAQISQMQLVSMSSQFRPHFILNALNTIGARMEKDPEAESVLSRLGESINLIFNHSKDQRVLNSLQNEWQLVKNVIYIHKAMYLKTLEVSLPADETIANYSALKIPMGLLQIPVENALLHGLGNKQTGSLKLQIEIEETKDAVRFLITDNGVGRAASTQLSNFTKHGTGTKNLEKILAIINQNYPDKISLHYEDGIFDDEKKPYGTRAIILIPKNQTYADQQT